MPSFRKKPVVIQAEQWFPDKPVKGVVQPRPKSMTQAQRFGAVFSGGILPPERNLGKLPPESLLFYPHIPAIPGSRVLPGDWIVVGASGEMSIVDDRAFKAIYVPVDDESARSLGWGDLDDYEKASFGRNNSPQKCRRRSILYVSECDKCED